MKFTIRPMDHDSVRTLVNWRYEAPYDVYNYDVEEGGIAEIISFYTNPVNQTYAIYEEDGKMIAFCSFGEDGRVPGGDYSEDALDIGLGVRPDATGKGQGGQFVREVIAFAQRTFEPKVLRVTIAAFNERAQRVWVRQGFHKTQEFGRTGDGMSFIVFTIGEQSCI